ncbi:MAG: hypothetical protein QM655_05130 [Nocardioidaceae bacterium]
MLQIHSGGHSIRLAIDASSAFFAAGLAELWTILTLIAGLWPMQTTFRASGLPPSATNRPGQSRSATIRHWGAKVRSSRVAAADDDF